MLIIERALESEPSFTVLFGASSTGKVDVLFVFHAFVAHRIMLLDGFAAGDPFARAVSCSSL